MVHWMHSIYIHAQWDLSGCIVANRDFLCIVCLYISKATTCWRCVDYIANFYHKGSRCHNVPVTSANGTGTRCPWRTIHTVSCKCITVEPLYSGHPWGTTFWPLYRGGLYWGVVLYTTACSFGTWVPGRYTEVALFRGGRYECSTVVPIEIYSLVHACCSLIKQYKNTHHVLIIA